MREPPRTVRAHDLLRLTNPGQLTHAAPAWVAPALVKAPWAVVRRSVASPGRAAVGVRGATRGQRWGTTIALADCVEHFAPEQLLDRIHSLRSAVPAACALRVLRERLHGLPLQWGPTGSAGFELATQVETLHRDSDLDIVVRGLPDRVLLDHLCRAIDALPARVDVQLELGIGAVALHEFMSGAHELLVKTPTGPSLVPVRTLAVRL